MRTYLSLLVAVGVLMVGPIAAEAQRVPETIAYQGTLADADGNPASGRVELTFRFFDTETGGDQLPASEEWTETHPEVAVTRGRFGVLLGSRTEGGLPDALFEDRRQLWLEIEVDGEVLSRTRVTSSAFAREAQSVVAGAIGADELADGAVVRAIIFQRSDETITATDNVTLAEGENIAFTPDEVTGRVTISATPSDDALGDISAVQAGTGLGGGGQSGDVTLFIQDEGIDSRQLATGAVIGRTVEDGVVQAGANITVTRDQNDNFVVAASDEQATVDVDSTLIGEGTADAPLGVNPEAVVTSVTAGPGLSSGEQTTGNITLSIADGGVGANQIATDAITAPKINTANSPSNGDFLKYVGGQLRWSDDVFFDSATQPSSIRWKENVRTLEDPLALVAQLRGVRFDWKEGGESDVGVIAEEVAQVLPELVEFDDDGQARGVHYAKLVAVLIEAIKDQQQVVKSKEETIQALRDDLHALEVRLNQVEHLLRPSSDTPSTGRDAHR